MNSYEIYEVTACPLSSRAWRNSEGTIISLGGDTLLLAYDQFYGPPYRWDVDDDYWSSRVMGKYSHDLGRTWGDDFLIQENDAKINILSPTLLQLQSGPIALFYRKTESVDPAVMIGIMKTSTDGGRSWSPEVVLPDRLPGGRGEYLQGRWFMPDANDCVIQLSNGRLVVPGGRVDVGTPDASGVEWASKVSSFCFLSDDDGETWRKGTGEFSAPGRGSMEPKMAELDDGRLIAIMRTDQGHVYRTYSHDRGETWSESEPIPEIVAPESCPSLGRIPGTNDLVLIFNHHFTPGGDHGGHRHPLSVALSRDGGQSWGNIQDLVVRGQGVWQDQKGQEHEWSWAISHPSITFVQGKMIVSYYEGVNRSPCHGMPCSLGVSIVDVGWLY
jgi:hypothetical protein